ncbi:phosphodiester glycosidase family protein [Massilia sp. CF038]|uniref:phosphodiester glycosidase family protein n=1 Tax=Massilia sp. CF038 TaxID=1881045 RepID=UPI000916F52C|nr:phosphodiester glycosidase family protein [Massilia sp. CF038]SHG45221.1 Uncharacterized protein YigE, DUF2233 family [Massilia sp. CF038]
MKKLFLSFLLLLALPMAGRAADPRFTVVTVDPAQQQLQLFLNDEAGAPFKGFARLDAWLQGRGQQLEIAFNAGMYHADFTPVGLLVQDGKQMAPLNQDDGKGNFFLKPNGVFLLDAKGAQVMTTAAYARGVKNVRLATQSGPMLVIDGEIHPAFNPESISRYVRNGVGVADGKVMFVISNHPVTFYELAAYFRDTLHCKNALYFDGSISSMYSRTLNRADAGAPLGPIIGVVRDQGK